MLRRAAVLKRICDRRRAQNAPKHRKLQKSIVFLKYALKMNLVKGEWFDLYDYSALTVKWQYRLWCVYVWNQKKTAFGFITAKKPRHFCRSYLYVFMQYTHVPGSRPPAIRMVLWSRCPLLLSALPGKWPPCLHPGSHHDQHHVSCRPLSTGCSSWLVLRFLVLSALTM